MFIDDFDLFLFDADGVIYIGDQPCPGSVEVIRTLQERGKGVRVLTNDSRYSRQEIQEKLKNMDIHLGVDDIITAAWSAARYLQRQGITKVQVVGTDALKIEIIEAGGMIVDHHSPETVVVGFNENLILRDIQKAIRSVEQGALFIATNYDISYPTPLGRQPASGSVVRLIETVTGRKAIIIGKPSVFIFQIAQEGYSGNQRTIMIGDSPEIDILGAHQADLPAILLSSQAIRYPTARDYRIPDGQIDNLFRLFDESFRLTLWNKPDFSWPGSIKVAVAALIFDDRGRVLLIKRKDNGSWALPTGKMELGETLEESVIREMEEELNLKVRVQRLVGVYSHPSHQVLNYGVGETIQFVTSCFLCDLIDGNLVNNQSEILESGFYYVSSFPQPMVASHKQWIQNAIDNQERTVYK